MVVGVVKFAMYLLILIKKLLFFENGASAEQSVYLYQVDSTSIPRAFDLSDDNSSTDTGALFRPYCLSFSFFPVAYLKLRTAPTTIPSNTGSPPLALAISLDP